MNLTDGEQSWSDSGFNVFQALRALQTDLDSAGILIGLNGARPNAATSGMQAECRLSSDTDPHIEGQAVEAAVQDAKRGGTVLGMEMTEDQLRERVKELAPFHHAVELPHGVNTYLPDKAHRAVEQSRVDTIMRHGWPQLLQACGGSLQGKRVLDIACNCGGFAVEAVKAGADYVLGVDIVDRYLEQADFIRTALEYDNLEFRNVDVYDLTKESVGTFDVVLCFGILYHLEDPIRGMKAMADLASHSMLVDTNLMWTKYVSRWLRNRPLWRMEVVGVGKAKGETTNLWRQGRSCQFAPSEKAVMDTLAFLGFDHVDFLPPTEKDLEPRYYKRKRGTFLAVR
jgi:tRNA (mo5U34)-methyltransferase